MRISPLYDKIERWKFHGKTKEMKLKKIYLGFDNNFSQTDEAFEAELVQVSEEVKKTASLAGHLPDSADSLLTTTEIQLT